MHVQRLQPFAEAEPGQQMEQGQRIAAAGEADAHALLATNPGSDESRNPVGEIRRGIVP